MIDLHCHLLPGIDDGPKTMEESLALARIASTNGITHAVVTPHIIPGRYDNSIETIKPVFDAFVKQVKASGIQLELDMAAEIRLDPVIIQMVNSNTLPYLGSIDHFRILLLEFPHETIPPGSMEMVKWLLERDIKPLIAHPERNEAVINKIKTIEPFVKAGCFLQITAGSLTGVFGKKPESLAKKLLKNGWVSIIASDAHNQFKRTPEIESGRLVAEKIVGEQESWQLVRDRPVEFTRNRFRQG